MRKSEAVELGVAIRELLEVRRVLSQLEAAPRGPGTSVSAPREGVSLRIWSEGRTEPLEVPDHVLVHLAEGGLLEQACEERALVCEAALARYGVTVEEDES